MCTLELDLPGAASLKDKRAILQSLLRRLHNSYNVSAAEIDHLNAINSAVIAFAVVSNSSQHVNSTISKIMAWIDEHYTDALIASETIEIL